MKLPATQSALTQHTRLVRLHTPLGPDVLVAEDVEVWEGVGPRPGPALGDLLDGDWGGPFGPWTLDASLGPARAGMRLVVHALSPDAFLPVESLVGQPALVELACPDGLRPWHGHVVCAGLVGSDGGLATYRLVVEPWLALLALRSDAWVFQDLSVPRVLDAVFSRPLEGGCLAPAWRWSLANPGAYPRRSLCVQHHESDLDFVQRLLLEEGLFCWWEHAGDADHPALGQHTLVVADHGGAFAPNAQPRVRFTQGGAPFEEDGLTRWREGAGVASGAVRLRSRDYRGLVDRPVHAPVDSAPALKGLQLSDAPGPYAYEDTDQGQRLAARQAEALGAARAPAHGWGAWRRAEAGTVFTLAEHPRHGGSDPERDRFVVLAAQHRARNNVHAHARARFPTLDDLFSASPQGEKPEERPLHEVALLAQPAARPVRPPGWPAVAAQGGFTGLAPMADGGELRDLAAWDGDLFAAPAPLRTLQPPDVRLNRAPTAAGMQSALVTGDKAVHTDRDARVRVQFHWQRGAQGSHRLPLPEGGACNAPGTAASSTWVRVGQSHGGFNHGALFLPRVGQEVLVGFIAGDVERPVVLGSLYNGRGRPDAPGNQVTWGCGAAVASTPPWFAGTARSGEHEGHAHPAVLTGHRSVSLDAGAGGYGGWSQFVFDDSAGAGRIELSTSQAATRLQLGALQQQERNQRLAPRGLGLGLDTEAQAALRAGAGLLLSAHAQASSTDNGQQMDVRAPLDVLRQGQERLRALAESAQAHGAQLPGEAGKPLPAARGLQALADSLAATQSNANGAAADGGFGTVAAWQRPELVLAAPAGVGLFTPAEAVFSAGTNAAFVAGQDVNVVAQGDHVLAARCGVVLYTFGKAASAGKPNAETGIAIHAAAGSVHASANTGAVRMAASQAVEVASTQGSVEVGSALSVLLAAAGAALKLEKGGIKVIAPGAVTVHAGLKEFTGPAIASGAGVHLPVPPEIHLNPQGPFSVRFAMQGADDLAADAALCGLPYRVCTLDGTVVAQGAIGKDGRIPRIETEFSEPVLLEIGEIDVASMTQLPVTKVHDAPDDASHVDANEESDASTFDEKYRPDEHREPKSKYEDALATAADRQYGIFLSEDVITTLIPLEQDSVSDAIRSIEE